MSFRSPSTSVGLGIDAQLDTDDVSSIAESTFTFATGSTVWGPGALTGKFLKAVGEMGLDVVVNVIIRRRLSAIKKTFSRRREIFLDTEATSAEEVQDIYHDLHELCEEYYPSDIRDTATRLLADITTYQTLIGVHRDLNARPRIFVDPQNEEETQLAENIYENIRTLFISDSCPKSMRDDVINIIRTIASMNAHVREHEMGLRWANLADSIPNERLEHVTITMFTETLTISDIQVRRIFEFREPDVRKRSVILEENAIQHYTKDSSRYDPGL